MLDLSSCNAPKCLYPCTHLPHCGTQLISMTFL